MGKRAQTRRDRDVVKQPVKLVPLRSSPNWPLLGLSVIGILLASYLTWTHWVGSMVKGCTVGSSCDIVLSSQWATLLGLPTSAWGLGAYITLAAVSFIKRADRHWWFSWLIAFFGVLYSAYLTTISLTLLHAACPYCLTSLALMTTIFAVTTFQRPNTLPNFTWGKSLARTAPVAVAAILLLHLNYTGILGDAPTAEDPQLRALALHLVQSGVKMYGASWCPHCKQQKSYFGAAARLLPYIECSPEGQGTPESQECRDAGVNSYPTWVINGKHMEEVMTLKQLADATSYQGPVPGTE